MSNFFVKRRLLLLLISLIVLVTTMGITLKDRPVPTWPERFVRDSLAFVQSIVYKPAFAVAGFFESIKDVYVVYEENKALKQNLKQFAQITADLNELKLENEQLRKMLEAEQSKLSDYKLRIAEVVARSPDRWNHTLIIDKGTKDGISPNMAVITPEGYIGRIQSVSHFSSQVELVTDIERGNHIGAIIQGDERIYGVVEGYDPKNNLLIMRKIPMQSVIEPKQMVITSGLGGTIPKGLVLGEIVSVRTDEQFLTKDAYIRPSANLNQLEKVFVVERSLIAPTEIPVPALPGLPGSSAPSTPTTDTNGSEEGNQG
ncbi:rod shape-determining protein MreC [Ammoniphilus sp. CFH 90114]|uniref:rod shape-determining protein MreC n=1 Tax=Ammoniphilus sp. CFH 90114 TaxID=2493665 RepID=UPI00100FB865|nr:rod shape-determining protein MreC [Ammoniphilus sp. CFH 90114]RXT14721.1 rod shape-determining protein MreC [Ammoniphilus sp. CFH 90114]